MAGSPYDEDKFMPLPTRSRELDLDAMAGQSRPTNINNWLNARLERRLPESTMGYITGDDYGDNYRPMGRFDRRGGGSEDVQMPTDPMQSRLNALLNRRLETQQFPVGGWHQDNAYKRWMSERIPHMLTGPDYDPTFPTGAPKGTDMDMMMLYGPEDQVAYDASGRPIRLDDPRHPRNQSSVNPMLESYPQQRRR